MSFKIVIADNCIKNIKFIMNKIINSIEEINIKSTKFVDTYQDKKILYNYFSLDIKITPKLVTKAFIDKILSKRYGDRAHIIDDAVISYEEV